MKEAVVEQQVLEQKAMLAALEINAFIRTANELILDISKAITQSRPPRNDLVDGLKAVLSVLQPAVNGYGDALQLEMRRSQTRMNAALLELQTTALQRINRLIGTLNSIKDTRASSLDLQRAVQQTADAARLLLENIKSVHGIGIPAFHHTRAV